MKTPSRREFLLQAAAPSLAVAMPMLIADKIAASESESALFPIVRWEEVDNPKLARAGDVTYWEYHESWWRLVIGQYPVGQGGTVFANLFRYSSANPDWTFRFGASETKFENCTAEEAKKLAEQELVQWLRQWLVELERSAFRPF